MKKIISITCVLMVFAFFSSTDSSAQPFQEGDLVLNAGFGLGTTYSFAGGSLGLPFGAGMEYGVSDLEKGSIGVGGDIGYVSGNGLSIFYLGAKGTYHFNEILELDNDKVDLYGGFGLYYRHFSFDGTGFNFGSGVFPGFHVGGRYYFADNIGAYGELGNNWGWLNLGIVVKM